MKTVDIRDLPRSFKASLESLDKRFRSALVLAAYDAQKILRKAAPEASGDLRKSIVVYETKKGAELRILAPHAKWVEYGTRPHWPNIGALEKWIQLRRAQAKQPLPRSPRGTFTRRFSEGKAYVGGVSLEVHEAAFLIARKIARDGTAPQPFIRPSMSKIREAIRKRMSEALNHA